MHIGEKSVFFIDMLNYQCAILRFKSPHTTYHNNYTQFSYLLNEDNNT